MISCPFNSFSFFGQYFSARFQTIWRPYLWLVWSFTQMVLFSLGWAFPALPLIFCAKHLLNAKASFSSSQRITTMGRWYCVSTQIHFLLSAHHSLSRPFGLNACPLNIPWHPHYHDPAPLQKLISSVYSFSLNKEKRRAIIGLLVCKSQL